MRMIIGPTCLPRTQFCGVMGRKSQSPTGRPCILQVLAAVLERFCFLNSTKNKQMGVCAVSVPVTDFKPEKNSPVIQNIPKTDS